jgi:hypothetical protein
MKCKTCGKNSDSEYCFQHKPKKGLQWGPKPSLTSKKEFTAGKFIPKKPFKPKRKLLAYKPKGYEAMYQEILKMRNFFMEIWKKRAHKSEVSGVYLGNEAMSTYFHHILPKEKYPEACLDEENIILLTLEEHSNVENDMYRYEEVNNRRNQLNLKYERT